MLHLARTRFRRRGHLLSPTSWGIILALAGFMGCAVLLVRHHG